VKRAEPPDELVSTDWLAGHLDDPGLVILDMRWRDDGSARSLYEGAHVPGALPLDWSNDIVDRRDRRPFMLAPPEDFARAMEERGIDDGTLVIAYADGRGSGPFRLWWAFRVYGHDTVRVLDGGFDTWMGEQRPIQSGPDHRPHRGARWTPRPPLDARPVADAGDVLDAAEDETVCVLDSRPPEQFRGDFVWFETGPVPADPDGVAHTARGDVRAGRVPWARNVPWSALYRRDHRLKSPPELRNLFAAAGVLPQASRAITYCGVGISASALLFALRRAGLDDVSLYDASWDEWGRLPASPVERG
jgi:thiosulfate/3-mercaptopyruvate sulfurtransferase